MAKPRKTLSLKGITPEQEALITRQEVPRIERIEKGDRPKPDPIEKTDPVPESVSKPATDKPVAKEVTPVIPKKEAKPEVAREPVKTPVPEEKEVADSEERQPAKKKKSRKKASSKSPVSEEVPDPWITKTYRLPASLIDRLQWVSLSRKMNKITPSTQQELMAQAITEWLEKNEE